MNIPNEMIENVVQHKYAGNGWAVVDRHPDEWSDCVYIGKGEVGHQFFRCWDKCLSLEKISENRGTPEKPQWVKTDNNTPIHHAILEKIKAIREKIASGKFKIENTRLVPA